MIAVLSSGAGTMSLRAKGQAQSQTQSQSAGERVSARQHSVDKFLHTLVLGGDIEPSGESVD